MSINSVAISGNLTRDPMVRKTSGGTSVMNFCVAVNDRRKDQQSGEWKDVPNYVDCVVLGRRADSLAQYLSKGTKVSIGGKLNYSSWEKDGQKHSKLEVLVNDLEFMSRGNGSGGQYQNTYQTAQASHQRSQQQQKSIYDSDIPF